ncbi:metal ABC transporter permease [Acholeplasma equifetale]|uniref:metal ABC transporter permease n=1 Tax=Acholeplasma equifetale TaxID=264634 RepID=UPI00138AB046|nr:metal ABC transporter permease [Acholeplasma equifetale]
MLDFIIDNYTLFVIILGTMLLSMAASFLGVFLILRKQALIGDAISHATLPGVVLAYILTHNKDMKILLLGAAFSAAVSIFILEMIKRYSKIKYDASLALVLSSFFGLGQILLQIVQGKGDAASAGLNKFIFGEAATMLLSDVILIGIVAFLVSFILIIFWKEIKLYLFNEQFFESLGFSSLLMRTIFTFLTIIVVVIGIRTVGVILMSALLIAPGVAARQWSNRLNYNVLIATLFSVISAIIGTIYSSQISHLPTGPVIVVCLASLVFLSLIFAPKRGILFIKFKNIKYKKMIKRYRILIHIYENNDKSLKIYDIPNFLINEGYVYISDDKSINLSNKGRSIIKKILSGDVR